VTVGLGASIQAQGEVGGRQVGDRYGDHIGRDAVGGAGADDGDQESEADSVDDLVESERRLGVGARRRPVPLEKAAGAQRTLAAGNIAGKVILEIDCATDATESPTRPDPSQPSTLISPGPARAFQPRIPTLPCPGDAQRVTARGSGREISRELPFGLAWLGAYPQD
jgi:hypothetical protein